MSKFIIHIATITIIWVLFLTNGHTLVPYFLKLPKRGCNTHSNKLAKKKTKKNKWPFETSNLPHIQKYMCINNDEKKKFQFRYTNCSSSYNQVVHITVTIVWITKTTFVYIRCWSMYILVWSAWGLILGGPLQAIVILSHKQKNLNQQPYRPLKLCDSQSAIHSVCSSGAVFCWARCLPSLVHPW